MSEPKRVTAYLKKEIIIHPPTKTLSLIDAIKEIKLAKEKGELLG